MTTANLNRRVFWAGLLLILAFTFTANAQEIRGLVAGKITDPNGAVVPGAKVEIKNTETGIVSTAVTGEDGTYNFPLLPPGKYQLTVTKENFNTAVRDGIEVRVADRLTLDVQLEIGVTAMVTTIASGLTLDTGMVQTGSVVTGKQIANFRLPKEQHINSRRLLPASHTQATPSSLVQLRMETSPRSDQMARQVQTRSHSTVPRTTHSTVASVSRLRLMQCRNSKFKQTPSTHSKATQPERR